MTLYFRAGSNRGIWKGLQSRRFIAILSPFMEPPHKRQKLANDNTNTAQIRQHRAKFLASLSKDVSPPPNRQSPGARSWASSTPIGKGPGKDVPQSTKDCASIDAAMQSVDPVSTIANKPGRVLSSPIQLTSIRDLPDSDNRDTVTLHDILGDPLIKEAWIFNFCFDVDWLMQHFDPDVRHMVKVKIVHGSWRREDMNKILIDDACRRLDNVDAIQAYLPDAFGTHHSKMFILIRHDDTAQVVIHTANMLAKDWTNMTQAVWRSPILPKKPTSEGIGDVGSGSRFRHDLLRYLKTYGSKLKGLAEDLDQYSFEEVRAALIASVPSKLKLRDDDAWGHEALRRTIQSIPLSSDHPHFASQVSSIASLPAKWMDDTLCRAMGSSTKNTSIIFPTADDVRVSLDGYSSGGSIHTKAQSPAHLKQISTLRPQLCRWAAKGALNAGRLSAAPHIKTYIRYTSMPTSECPCPSIEWALLTSANLSTQAWGSTPKLPKGEKDPKEAIVHVQSYEIGVLVWPALFGNSENLVDEKALGLVAMVPTFCTDLPPARTGDGLVVGFRMPYDLPLTPYKHGELPWSPQSSYSTPDSHGSIWPPPGN